MKFTRRTFFSTTAASLVAASLPTMAIARTVKYTPSKFNQFINSRKTFLLGVHAEWCSTCDRQKRVLNQLRSKGEPYKSMTMLAVDWDKDRKSPLIGKYNVPRRSTLIMFKNGKEVGRVVAGTGTSQIKALIDKGY